MRSIHLEQFTQWLRSLPNHDGLLQLSPTRPYAHAEMEYDAQYGVVGEHPEEGEGLCALLRREKVETDGPALEIGCGTGELTTGLATFYPGPAFLVTDASFEFLQITKRRLASRPRGATQLHFAILNGEDLAHLPKESFSLIALRSTLHHILDFEGFIRRCAERLHPGGALAMSAEPCESGYVLMGAAAHSIGPAFAKAGVPMKPEWRHQAQLMADTMKFYCRRDLDKTAAEDKHLFRIHELTDEARQCGMELRFFPNVAYAGFAVPIPNSGVEVRFSSFFLSYIRYCMSFDLEFVGLIETHLHELLEYVDSCYPTHAGPIMNGVYLFVKM